MWKILVFWKTLAVYSWIVFRDSQIFPLHESICCFSVLEKKADLPWCLRAGAPSLARSLRPQGFLLASFGQPQSWWVYSFFWWSECGRAGAGAGKKTSVETSTDPLGCFGPCHLQLWGELNRRLVERKFWSQDCRYQKPPNHRMVANNEMNHQAQRVRISFFRITRCSGSRLGNLLLPNLLAAKGLWASWHA